MKLTVFSSETLPKNSGGNRSTGPKLSMLKSGLITLNYALQDLMGIKEGDKISLAQDDDAQWFIYKDKEGFDLRWHTDKKSMCFNHNNLKHLFYESIGRDQTVSSRFLIAGQPTVFDKVKYWGILVG
jgi:hypothetical protein